MHISKKLIVCLILLITSVCFADWYFNQYNGKQDYYIPAGTLVGGLSIDDAEAGDDGKFLVVDCVLDQLHFMVLSFLITVLF